MTSFIWFIVGFLVGAVVGAFATLAAAFRKGGPF